MSETPYVLDVFIETSKNSKVKYEYDSDYSCMRCEKIYFEPIPFNYGFIPNTEKDDSPLDVIILSEIPFNSHTIIEARIIGLFNSYKTIDLDEFNKIKQVNEIKQIQIIICVPVNSITFDYNKIKDIRDIDTSILNKISNFWSNSNDFVFKNAEEGLKLYKKNIITEDDDITNEDTYNIIDISDCPI